MTDETRRTESEGSFLELLLAAGIEPPVESKHRFSNIRITSITSDSRKVRGGSCFVALPGERYDGSTFIDDAIRSGGAAVVSESMACVPPAVGAIRVRDARSAMARLAAAYYGFAPGQKFAAMRLVGVTGTNGKTTTCTLLQSIFRSHGWTTALIGTTGYDLVGETRAAPWTTPPPLELYECLATAAGHGARHAVMEVSSHALAQSRCDGHQFAGALFTNLSGDHLDYHRDVDTYAAAKKKLFDELSADAVAVVNADDPMADRMVADCAARVVRFSINGRAEIHSTIEDLSSDGCRFRLHAGSKSTDVHLRLVGRHAVANATGAAVMAMSMAIDPGQVRAGLEAVADVRGRLQRVDTGNRGFSVYVDYAHTDDALVHALHTLRDLTQGRLICVFGCGGDRDRTKRPRMARAVATGADLAVVTSDNPRQEAPNAIIADIVAGIEPTNDCEIVVLADRRMAIGEALRRARPGDAVLIAGKGHEDYQIVGDARLPFDDVQVARNWLNEARGKNT